MGDVNTKTKSQLTEGIISYLQSKTNLTRAEIEEWHEEFLEDCPSGKLDKKMFRKMMKKSLTSKGNAEKFCDIAFRAFDKDDSGYIPDFQEFMLVFAANDNEKLANLFDVFDIDKNGTIEFEEMVSVFTALNDMNGIHNDGESDPRVRAEKIMRNMDKSNNTGLTKAEFFACCVKDKNTKNLFPFDS
ncbi:hypothetical protein ACOME3_004315 [Neoechinorhynchus agilis]